MKHISKNQLLHIVLLAAVLLVAAYFLFGHASKGEAVTTISTGSLAVMIAPYPIDIGTEVVEFTFNGLSELDMTGWVLKNDNGLTFVFPPVVLDGASGEVRLCGDKAKDGLCDYAWSGGDVWPDMTGLLTLSDESGNIVISFTYSVSGSSETDREVVELTQTVLESRDKIASCHSKGGTKYTSVNLSAGNVADKKTGHTNHEFDIIPPFFYRIDSKVGYFEGKNWEAGESVHAGGCSSS